jgi:hypothetical protein
MSIIFLYRMRAKLSQDQAKAKNGQRIANKINVKDSEWR